MNASMIRLSAQQKDEKEKLENVIRSGIKTFQEVGDALARIWAGRLYADEYNTFEQYCRGKWNIGERRAHQLVSAAEVQKNIGTTVQIPSERVARELSKLPKVQQLSAAKMLANEGGEITAAKASAVVNQVRKDWPKEEPDHPLPPPKRHPEMDLNLKPSLSIGEKARAYATISEWYESHKSDACEKTVRKILALFR